MPQCACGLEWTLSRYISINKRSVRPNNFKTQDQKYISYTCVDLDLGKENTFFTET